MPPPTSTYPPPSDHSIPRNTQPHTHTPRIVHPRRSSTTPTRAGRSMSLGPAGGVGSNFFWDVNLHMGGGDEVEFDGNGNGKVKGKSKGGAGGGSGIPPPVSISNNNNKSSSSSQDGPGAIGIGSKLGLTNLSKMVFSSEPDHIQDDELYHVGDNKKNKKRTKKDLGGESIATTGAAAAAGAYPEKGKPFRRSSLRSSRLISNPPSLSLLGLVFLGFSASALVYFHFHPTSNNKTHIPFYHNNHNHHHHSSNRNSANPTSPPGSDRAGGGGGGKQIVDPVHHHHHPWDVGGKTSLRMPNFDFDEFAGGAQELGEVGESQIDDEEDEEEERGEDDVENNGSEEEINNGDGDDDGMEVDVNGDDDEGFEDDEDGLGYSGGVDPNSNPIVAIPLARPPPQSSDSNNDDNGKPILEEENEATNPLPPSPPPPPPAAALPTNIDPTSLISTSHFLPYTCPLCSPGQPLDLELATCAKYLGRGRELMKRSIAFAGTGREVRRVLGRAARSSRAFQLSLSNNNNEQTNTNEPSSSPLKPLGSEPFRVLVLGGSVSNCRGVEEDKECWHAHLKNWFKKTFPLVGDESFEVMMGTPNSFLRDTDNHHHHVDRDQDQGQGQGQDLTADKDEEQQQHRDQDVHVVEKREEGSTGEVKGPKPTSKSSGIEGNVLDSAKKLLARGGLQSRAIHDWGKKKMETKGRTRKHPKLPKAEHQLTNLAKSATGSAFFSYCLDSELKLRGKGPRMRHSPQTWGDGPDLVVLEFGVNDVFPVSSQATKDFERLIRLVRSLPSRPAIVILEAASLLLAKTTGADQNAEMLHLPVAEFYDIPIISMKGTMFSGSSFNPASFGLPPLQELFLPDSHHPNALGHELMADVLISYLEKQACEMQSEALARLTSRRGKVLDPMIDFPSRQDERVLNMSPRSLFAPFDPKASHPFFETKNHPLLPPPKATCLQIGNKRAHVNPVENQGWSQYAWARDKQYLIASEPGSTVSFDVKVGAGGDVLVDWLRSRGYSLGDALVYLDGDKSGGVQISGFWDLGWSIGVPTALFTNVPSGHHRASIQLLDSSRSSHPEHKTNFRLIGIICT